MLSCHLVLLISIALIVFLVTDVIAYAGHTDGIMRGNRPLNLSNSKHANSSPNDETKSNPLYIPSRNTIGFNGVKVARFCQPASQQATYFEELWGNIMSSAKDEMRLRGGEEATQFETLDLSKLDIIESDDGN
mmetsp:Transcript_8165/g.17516  ORF Transcript_8165/g.17516 Transcript_8165/m.17516 type:complete len:133 (-) Transcript_8165:582-980(-)